LYADDLSKAQGVTNSESNVIDLYHNKEIDGGVPVTAPPPVTDYLGLIQAIGKTIYFITSNAK